MVKKDIFLTARPKGIKPRTACFVRHTTRSDLASEEAFNSIKVCLTTTRNLFNIVKSMITS